MKSPVSTNCPDESAVRSLLRASGVVSEQIEYHIDHCGDCQRRLAKLSEEDGVASNFRDLLQSIPPTADLVQDRRMIVDSYAADAGEADERGGEAGTLPHQAALPVVAGYELIQEIGRGGMGAVYEARHLALNRKVALKMLIDGRLADPQHRSRLRVEAEAIAKLSHPGIVRIYDVCETDGLSFLALELVSGTTLADCLTDQPQDPIRSARLVLRLAEILQHVHDQGIVHRDIKPANILLEKPADEESVDPDPLNWNPRVTDFGLALRSEDPRITSTGQFLGTPAYVAPEQVTEHSLAAGPAADIYSLGVVLFELISGCRPFQKASPFRTVEAVVNEPAPDPRLHVPNLPRAVADICLRCMEKNPENRFGSATELAAALKAFCDATMEPMVAETFKHHARFRPHFIAIPVIATTFIALPVLYHSRSARHEASVKPPAVTIATDSETRVQDESAYVDGFQTAYRLWESRDVGETLSILRSLPPRQRSWEWGYLHRQCDQAELTIAAHEGRVHDVISPIGLDRIISSGSDSTIRIWNFHTGRLVKSIAVESEALALAAFPNRNVLVSGHQDGRLRRWNTDSWNLTESTKLSDHAIQRLRSDWSGERLIVATEADEVGVISEADNGSIDWIPHTQVEVMAAGFEGGAEERLVLASDDGQISYWRGPPFTCDHTSAVVDGIREITFARDSNQPIVVNDSTRWYQYSAGAANELAQALYNPVMTCATIPPNGNVLFVGGNDGGVASYSIRSPRQQSALCGHHGPVTCLTVGGSNPNDTHAISGGSDGAVRRWPNLSSLIPLPPLRHHDAARCLAIAPDGKHWVTGGNDGKLIAWDSQSERASAVIGSFNGKVENVTYSPDGRLIAAAVNSDDEGSVVVLHTATGQSVATIDGIPGPARGIVFSLDGRTLLTRSRTASVMSVDIQSMLVEREFGNAPTPTRSIVLSPDGRWVAAKTDGSIVELWSAADGTSQFRIQAHDDTTTCLEFSRDGRFLATSGRDALTRIWSVPDGQLIKTLPCQKNIISGCDFNAQGTRLVTVQTNGMLRIWAWKEGRELLGIRIPGATPTDVKFHPDGKRLLVTRFDGSLKILRGGNGPLL